MWISDLIKSRYFHIDTFPGVSTSWGFHFLTESVFFEQAFASEIQPLFILFTPATSN